MSRELDPMIIRRAVSVETMDALVALAVQVNEPGFSLRLSMGGTLYAVHSIVSDANEGCITLELKPCSA